MRPSAHSPDEATLPRVPVAHDGALVSGAVSGDPDAIEALLLRLSCVVRFVARLNRTLGYGLATEVLEDVVQQVYTAVWRRLRDYHGGEVTGAEGSNRPGIGSLETWVFGFCRNCLRAEARKRATRLRILRPSDDPGVLEHRASDPEQSPEMDAERRERLDLVREEVARLPEGERSVVEMRHLEDRSFEQIARELGVAASTVKDRCYRGLSKIEERLRRLDV